MTEPKWFSRSRGQNSPTVARRCHLNQGTPCPVDGSSIIAKFLQHQAVAGAVKSSRQGNPAQRFELARKNLQELAKKGNKALDELIMLAKNSEHPRAYEVVATLIKTLADTNKDLLETRKRKIDIDKARGVQNDGSPKTVNNNLFVGSTAELQKFERLHHLRCR